MLDACTGGVPRTWAAQTPASITLAQLLGCALCVVASRATASISGGGGGSSSSS